MPHPLRIAVIGGGPMGMAVAYELGRLGHAPVLLEADDRLGGMAASFNFAGVPLERYYHFHCLSDQAFFELLRELDLAQDMRWRQTRMGFYYNGQLYPWGSAGAVLGFRPLPLLTRIRYLLHAARCLTLRNWRPLDERAATQWLRRWLGPRGYAVLWEKLFSYKFYEHSDTISAAWIWSRIRRIGLSRRGLKETLGYLEGGSQRWIDALAAEITRLGGSIRTSSPVSALTATAQGVVRVSTPAGEEIFDAVISTVPLPLVAPLLEKGGAPEPLVRSYADQPSVACACVVLQTRQPITGNFWTNVNDARFAIPGVIEMGNLQPRNPHITYVPFYMPANHPDYQRPNEAFIADSIACLKALRPNLQESDVIAGHCSRYRFAQPVCSTRFMEGLPPLEPLPNLWIADTTIYYPEDRGISESVGFGRDLARNVSHALSVRSRSREPVSEADMA